MKGLVFLLAVTYLVIAWKFWSGFRRTDFIQNRIGLTIFWPVMLISSGYRRNFSRAIKGG
ncbi:MAG: hypothetical protein HC860_07935 [Alkalinema sp. RU_4_3]|nr:hypothetical protein [Alkalinema sp. RU_4_3]